VQEIPARCRQEYRHRGAGVRRERFAGAILRELAIRAVPEIRNSAGDYELQKDGVQAVRVVIEKSVFE
jgi:hypothetical protein